MAIALWLAAIGAIVLLAIAAVLYVLLFELDRIDEDQ
jgi:hypothetical protein